MKYEIIKGSENDFEGESDDTLTVYRIIGSGNTYYSQYPSDKFAIGVDVIAERRPIAEPVVNQQLTTEFDADGLPIAGTECEAKYRDADNAEWFVIRCVGVDCGVVFGWAGKDAVTLGKGSYEFRAIRSPEDVERDEAVKAMFLKVDPNIAVGIDARQAIYDAIAAGKIPGVKLEAL